MKTNRTLIILSIVFLCLICLTMGGAGYFYFANQPPNRLNDSGYYIRITKVYYYPGFGLSEPFEIEGAHVSTFEILDELEQYAKDINHVYFDGVIISQADPATFELMESPFSRDVNHVYLGENIFSNDPAHFEIVQGNLMRDSNHIYWSDEIISDDPVNLEIIQDEGFYNYFTDSTTVFLNGGSIEGANVNTFEVISDAYSRDDSQIFYFTSPLPADISTFEILEIPYSRDSQNVFWMENIIPNADAQTFRVMNANFECSADSERAYHRDQLIPNFDPNIIPTNSQVTNCDSNGLYSSP